MSDLDDIARDSALEEAKKVRGWEEHVASEDEPEELDLLAPSKAATGNGAEIRGNSTHGGNGAPAPGSAGRGKGYTLDPPSGPASPEPHLEPPKTEPARSGLSFVKRYFESPGKVDVAEEFRHADIGRLCFKTALCAAGAFAIFDSISLATTKDEEGKTHPYKALMAGGAGITSLGAGLLMRGVPLR